MLNHPFHLAYQATLLSFVALLTACQPNDSKQPNAQNSAEQIDSQSPFDIFTSKSDLTPTNSPPLVKSARSQIGITTSYDPTYRNIGFPMGDVPTNTGVCTDVVIRAYRNLGNGQGKDLQRLVNVDMQTNWNAYPKLWGLPKPDTNIDHRGVPNLEVFFTRHSKKLSLTDRNSFKAGDLVTWRLTQDGKKLPHIGIVSDKKARNGTPLIIHNIGRGTEESDILYKFPISGHFRY